MPANSVTFSPLEAVHAKLILMGPPGALHRRVQDSICSLKETEHVSTEALFRDEIRRGSTSGQQHARALAARSNPPEAATHAVMRRWFWSRKSHCGFALSGFPENRRDASLFDEWLENRDEALTGCIWFDLSRSTALAEAEQRQRCPECGRHHYPSRDEDGTPGLCAHCRSALVADGTIACSEVAAWFDHKESGYRSAYSHYHEQGLALTLDATAPIASSLRGLAANLRALAADR